MKVLFVLFLAIASALAASFESDSDLQPEARITYAGKAKIKNYNYQVGLDSNGKWCGGALISNVFILTAAHCVFGVPPTKVTAYLGKDKRKKGTKRHAESILTHEEFNMKTLENDIALIRIPAVDLSKNINVIGLPELGIEPSFEGEIGVVSGWGKTDDGSNLSKYLRVAELPIISNADCAKSYGSVIKSSTICTSTVQKNSPCDGDIGGPLVLKKQHVLVGIISILSPFGCASLEPVGFSRISSYREWIKNYAGV